MLNGITSVETQVAPVAVTASPVSAPSPVARAEREYDYSPPFVSPAIRVDPIANQVVLEFRDSESGEVLKQVPSPQQVQAAYGSFAEVKAPAPETTTVSGGDTSFEAAPAARPVENNTQSSQSLGPVGTLGDGDTSSFSV